MCSTIEHVTTHLLDRRLLDRLDQLYDQVLLLHNVVV